MKGRPAPHNVMTGLWEPSAADAAKGLPEGFGAVTKLLKPEACGKGSGSLTGQVWRDAWMYAKEEFALTKVPVTGGTTTEDATTSADKDDCRGADESAFPGGAWATLPTYLTKTYKVGGVVRGAKSYRCWGT